MASLSSSSVSPIVNDPAGMNAIPSAVGASVADNQFGETRLVALCKTPFVPLVVMGHKRMT